MQRAPGEERLFRVPYGAAELEFMLQPWFDIHAGTPAAGTQYDIVIVGVGKPDDVDLARAIRVAVRVCLTPTPLIGDGGAVIIPAQLEDGAGDDLGDDATRLMARAMVVIAASEAPEVVRLAGLRAAVDVEEALDIAYEHIGRPQRASVLLMRA